MLFELKISTDNAAEFSSFAADFHKFLEKWNSSAASSNAAQPNAPASLQFRAPVGRDRIAGDAGATVSQPSLSGREGVASAPETDTPSRPAVSGAEVPEDKPKRHRRTKAEIEAARTAEAQPATKAEPVSAVDGRPYSIDDVKAAYNAMCKALGPKSRGVSAEMLLELGVAKFSELKPEQFGIAIDKMQRKASQPTKTAEAVDDEIAF